MTGLELAVREVDERIKAGTCKPPALDSHPQSLRFLGQMLDERDQQQGEAAEPAA